ncbi:hypothetical protein HB779_17460 [Phyllobacterium sp. 628]|uniref:hypothetical protein n=1 Tax=Phyllobacterium sp. 628 TaxID=2718938 RepID=UPI0016623920|nr:hypothetical protein [Phyllobacterium sp. 628]QND53475.1 hypothetical protein HB779_17460 [Phyllobacterium sp. 628]
MTITETSALKPLDLSNLLRHAFLTGRGINGTLSDDDLKAWTEYDPTDLGWYRRVEAALSPEPAQLPQDVINLVIAVREVVYESHDLEKSAALDKAVEAFAERVPWDNDPAQFLAMEDGEFNGNEPDIRDQQYRDFGLREEDLP